MHGMAYLLGSKTPKNVPITGESTCATSQKNSKVEILAKKKHVFLSFSRGVV